MSEQGRKYDSGKLRYDLIPTLSFEEVTKVVTKGAEKYDDENWKNVPEGRRRYLAAAMRHIQEWRKGNIYDDEMGTHHIANAISNLMFILEKELQGWGDISEFTTGGFLTTVSEGKHYDSLLNEVKSLRDDLKKMTSGVNIDISQDSLKAYVDSITESKEEPLWYPPVEDGGNSWIEYDGRGCPVKADAVVEVLCAYERSRHQWRSCPGKSYGWCWHHSLDDQDIVAYRVVS